MNARFNVYGVQYVKLISEPSPTGQFHGSITLNLICNNGPVERAITLHGGEVGEYNPIDLDASGIRLGQARIIGVPAPGRHVDHVAQDYDDDGTLEEAIAREIYVAPRVAGDPPALERDEFCIDVTALINVDDDEDAVVIVKRLHPVLTERGNPNSEHYRARAWGVLRAEGDRFFMLYQVELRD